MVTTCALRLSGIGPAWESCYFLLAQVRFYMEVIPDRAHDPTP